MYQHISQRCAACITERVTMQGSVAFARAVEQVSSPSTRPLQEPTRPPDSAANDDSQAGPSGHNEVPRTCSSVTTIMPPGSIACLRTHRICAAVTRATISAESNSWRRRSDQCAFSAQGEVQSLRNSLAEWQSISELAGIAEAFIMGPVTPAAVASELARARESEKQLQVRHRPGVWLRNRSRVKIQARNGAAGQLGTEADSEQTITALDSLERVR